jgi:hypothetical protein
MTEVSATRLYLGNMPKGVTKQDVEAHFATHGTGEITEIKLMNGFGFIEYKDAMDARDVVPGKCLSPLPKWLWPQPHLLTRTVPRCNSLPYVLGSFPAAAFHDCCLSLFPG